MSHLRSLNQQQHEDDPNAPFWEWVEAMGGGPDHEKKQQDGGEGSSRAAAGEKHKHEHQASVDDYPDVVYRHDEDTEMPPPDYDGEDPPTPPEEYPMLDEKALPDRSADKEKDGKDKDGEGRRCGGPGMRGRGRCGGRGGGGGGPGAWHHGHHGPHGWGHGPWGGRGRGGMFRGRGGHWGAGGPPPPPPPFGFGHGPFGGPHGGPPNWGGNWMEMAKKFAERLGLDPSQIPTGARDASDEDGVDFSPAIDVYSTPTEYVVHVALPGANKEDVAVTWDEEEAALNVGGVITRGVDEELANQLALGERPVGVFRRKIRLGDKEHPARVDADGIRAAMEEGILKIRVRKAEHEPAEPKKVQVQ